MKMFAGFATYCLVREFDIWITAENTCEEPGPAETEELQGQTEAKAGELEQAAKIPETWNWFAWQLRGRTPNPTVYHHFPT